MEFKLNRINLINLGVEEVELYKKLLLPSAFTRWQREQDPKESYWVAAEARTQDKLIGFALAEVYISNQTAQLYSWMVEGSYRRQGVGLALFRFLQEDLSSQEKIVAMGFEYEEGSPYQEAIEKVLAHQKWPHTFLYLIRCYLDCYEFDAKWLYHPYRLPLGMAYFKWKDLTEEDRKILSDLGNDQRIPSYLSPLKEESMIDLETSVGLRHEGRLIGWSITHRLSPFTLRYSILYIDPSFRSSGLGIQLLLESLRLHDQLMYGPTPIPYAVFEVRLAHIYPSWERFIKKRFIPFSYKVERMKWTFKVFMENALKVPQ